MVAARLLSLFYLDASFLFSQKNNETAAQAGAVPNCRAISASAVEKSVPMKRRPPTTTAG